MQRPYRRRLIVGKFPNRFSGTNVNFFLLLFLVFGAVLFGPLMISMESDHEAAVLSQGQAATYFLQLQKVVWPAVVILFGLLFVATVIFTHRIAGPLYRLRNVLKVVGEGNLTVRASIRKYDYLHQEVDCINEMIDSLRTKVRDIEAQYREAQASMLELNSAAQNSDAQDTARQIQRLHEQMERLGERLGQFRTVSSD
jgi:methyl-accepting chemotaxis protein